MSGFCIYWAANFVPASTARWFWCDEPGNRHSETLPARSRRSMLTRILTANIAIAGLSVVSITALFLFSSRSEFEHRQFLRARMMAEFLARQSEVPALIGDRGGMEKIAASAIGAQDVLSVRIRYRGDPREVLASRRTATEAAPRSPATAAKRGWRLPRRFAPFKAGCSIGTRRVRRGPQAWVASSCAFRSQRTGAVPPDRGAVAAGYGRPAGPDRGRAVLPDAEIASAARGAGGVYAAGGYGRPARTSPVDQVDEIADVAVAFNQMLDRLGRTTVSRDYVDNIIGSMAECLVVVGMDGRIRTVNEATLDFAWLHRRRTRWTSRLDH